MNSEQEATESFDKQLERLQPIVAEHYPLLMNIKSTIEPVDTQGETALSRDAKAPENTSGQGRLAIVPREVEEWNQGWNLGAFGLGWIWSAWHNVWIGLLCLVPFAGIIMLIVLGMKGNEWAWQYRRWDSIEHFEGTQKQWGDWGQGVFIIEVFLLIVIIANQF